MEFLFTFGTLRTYPFQRGYIIINAKSYDHAVETFRKHYPDDHKGTLNCADIYFKPSSIADFKENGNLGEGCHKYIDAMHPMMLKTMIEKKGTDIDTYDISYDITVTTCLISNEDFEKYSNEAYYRFSKFIYEHVEVVNDTFQTCNYTGFVEKYKSALQRFMKEHWKRQYNNYDEFVPAWISEIDGYLAGSATEQNYADLLEALEDEERVISQKNKDYER